MVYSICESDGTEYTVKGCTKKIVGCHGDYKFPKPNNPKICYRDYGWANYYTGYWGKDNCVCADQICETEVGAALAATAQPWRTWWTGNCKVTKCPWV